jgi:hypothetical protein
MQLLYPVMGDKIGIRAVDSTSQTTRNSSYCVCIISTSDG